ncbi:MAG: hypothetical protein AAFY76_22125, partial [Cyanobacteria bacterium J06649_11]
PARDLHNFSTLCKKFKEMLRHVDRHHNEVVFKRCDDRSCCQPFRSERLRDISLFAPSPDAKRPGHFQTFLNEMSSTSHRYGDDGQPSVEKKGLGNVSFYLVDDNYFFNNLKKEAK